MRKIETEQEVILSMEELTMDYSGQLVLKGLNLEVRSGQIIGYIGPNGAGKSTTVRILLGLQQGYGGTARLFGKDIRTSGISYKSRIGYVPETAEVYDMLTAREYLVFVGGCYGMDDQRAERKGRLLMEQFGLSDVVDSRLSSFSKGMRQKVLIISSLLHNPDLLFFDEPLSGLDANSVLVFKEIIAKLADQGKTIFYSSHIMDIVEKISHRIVLLYDGQIAADGTFEELKTQNKEGSLEEIFNQLTGFHQHAQIADNFVSIVEEV
ncbi:ABC transporter ATP-binding protein [Sporolactobacillus shoreicorticis]|uniref:ABC transporter ATP-binding protein n=1 Tax=Sporolactobacillus shoreicorticis TaxID=1923877 RepID=A0ABW5S7L2_9BACL|nr:ABC transporter ATP-binding protein [Sporolactobacillus shoreicorticis]MCO7125455.1 ABC transporter ATP-binding protein [Sporolactobacillus shoreicorticis]